MEFRELLETISSYLICEMVRQEILESENIDKGVRQ